MIRGVIDKFVSFSHMIIIYGWIYIIFYHYQHQYVVIRRKTLKCKVRQTSDATMTLIMLHVGDVVNMLENRCGLCTLSGYKSYSVYQCDYCEIFRQYLSNKCYKTDGQMVIPSPPPPHTHT